MIRNVVLGRLRAAPDAVRAADDRRALEDALEGIAALRLPGQHSMETGLDRQLRDGSWDFAITNVWSDADAYRAYDVDPEHNVHRRRIAEVSEQLARVQFEC